MSNPRRLSSRSSALHIGDSATARSGLSALNRMLTLPVRGSIRTVSGILKLFVSTVSGAKARSPGVAIVATSSSSLSRFHRLLRICKSKFASTRHSSRSNTTPPSMSTPNGQGLATVDSTASIPPSLTYRGYRRPASVGASTYTFMLVIGLAPTALGSISATHHPRAR